MPDDAMIFLNNWVQENINAASDPSEDKIDAAVVQLIAEAKLAGYSTAALEEAAGTGLATYVASEMGAASERRQ